MKRKYQKSGSDVRVEFLCHPHFKALLQQGKTQVGSVAEYIKTAVLGYEGNLCSVHVGVSNIDELLNDDSGLISKSSDGKLYFGTKEVRAVFLADSCYLFYVN